MTCSLDGARFSACASPATYQAVAAGKHTFVVSAAGKGGTATASTQWQVNPTTNTAVTPLGVPGSWTLKFDDEFNGTSLDLTQVAAQLAGRQQHRRHPSGQQLGSELR